MAMDLTEAIRQSLAKRAKPMDEAVSTGGIPFTPKPSVEPPPGEATHTPTPEPPPTEASHTLDPSAPPPPESTAPPLFDSMKATPAPLPIATDQRGIAAPRLTIQQYEQANVGNMAPQALGSFAAQFAAGGQGPKSYTHSLRPERGTVVR